MKERRNKRISTDTVQVLITYSAIITSIIAFIFLPDQLQNPIKLIPSRFVEDAGNKTQIFILPLLVFFLGIVITFHPRSEKKLQEGRKPYVLFVRLITVLMTLILGVQLLYAFGVTFALTVLDVVIGAGMAFIGLRVRREKRRFALRIRTKWMIRNKSNKKASEKFYWQTAVIFGILQIVASFLFTDYIALGTGILFVVILIAGTVIYSNIYHKKHIATESIDIDADEFSIREDKRSDD